MLKHIIAACIIAASLTGCAVFRENPNLSRAFLATVPGDVESVLAAVEVFNDDADVEKFRDGFSILWPIIESKMAFLITYYGATAPAEVQEIQKAVDDAKAKADAILGNS